MASKKKVLPVERKVDVYGTNTFTGCLKIAFCHFSGVRLPANVPGWLVVHSVCRYDWALLSIFDFSKSLLTPSESILTNYPKYDKKYTVLAPIEVKRLERLVFLLSLLHPHKLESIIKSQHWQLQHKSCARWNSTSPVMLYPGSFAWFNSVQ